MLSRRWAAPSALIAAAVLATIALPLGISAVATPSPSVPPSAAAEVDTPAGPEAAGPRPGPSAAPIDAVRLTGPAVLWTGETRTWISVSRGVAGRALAGAVHSTVGSATGAATTWTFPPPGAIGPVSQGSLCITIPNGPAGTTVTTAACTGAPAQQISLVASANGQAMRSAASGDLFVDFDPKTNTFQLHNQNRGDGVQTNLLAPLGRRALAVTSVAPGETGSATVSGLGTPGGAVLNGDDHARIGVSGDWSLTVSGIPAAGATIRFAQSINGELYTHADAAVPGWPVTPGAPGADTTFPDDVTANALVHGTGIDGASVSIRYDGEEIGTARVENGAWSTDIDSLGSGSHELSVTQEKDGLVSAPVTVTIDYGAPVTITEPVDGSTIEVEGAGTSSTLGRSPEPLR